GVSFGKLILWDWGRNGRHQQLRLDRSAKELHSWPGQNKVGLMTDKTISLYASLEDPSPQYWPAAERQRITASAFSADGRYLAYGDEMGHIFWVSLFEERPVIEIKGAYVDEILQFATEFSYRPDSLHADEFPGLPFDPMEMKKAENPVQFLRDKIPGHWGSVRGLAFLEEGPYLISAGQDWSLKVWDLKGNKLSETAGMQSLPSLDALRGGDAMQLQQQIQVQADPFANNNLDLNHVLGGAGQGEPIRRLIRRPAHQQLLSIDERKQLQLFTPETGNLDLLTAKGEEAVFSADGKQLYLLDFDQLSAYELGESASELRPLWQAELPNAEASIMKLSPSGEILTLGTRKGELWLYRADKWDGKLALASAASVSSLAWVDENTMLVGQDDRKVNRISLDTEAMLEVLERSLEENIVGIRPTNPESQRGANRGSGSVRSR
ncbi:MAG: WD40 repeat domain-containing protein, partial [Bacteroidota bacterium]